MNVAAPASQDRAKGGFTIDGVRVRGIVGAVPATPVSNAYFERDFSAGDVLDTTRMIGVERRHWASAGQTTGDLCREAAATLLHRLDWAPASVDALIFVSQTPDHVLPATACILQHSLGLSKQTAAFDVGLGCSGYVYGLWMAAALLKAGCDRVLLLAGDTISRMVDRHDRGTALLFGDAGSATALERDDAIGPAVFRLGSDGGGANNLSVARGGRSMARGDTDASDRLFMDGSQVFSFTLKAVPALIRETLADASLKAEDVDFFVLHQANTFMLQHIAKKLGVPGDKMPINLDRFGNTSAASIPLLIATDVSQAVLAQPTNLVMAGFGVGYSWAACAMNVVRMDCAEVIFV